MALVPVEGDDCDSVLTEEAVDQMDVIDLLDLAEKMDISLNNFQEAEDMKEVFKCLISKWNHGSPWMEVKNCLNRTAKDYIVNRKKLVELLEETIQALQRPGDTCDVKFIEELLKTEGITEGLDSDFTNQNRQLRSREVPILVSGETSSGKSTLLNLLLDGWKQCLPNWAASDQELLPTHILSMTSTITRISYGRTSEARIHFKTGEVLNIPQLETEEGRVTYYAHVCSRNESKREEVSNIQEIQLKLPLPILKCGLVLVDTPGIGENEQMDDVVAEYVSQNSIMGFIYVIKSDNANGGIADDRLVHLLQAILQKKKDALFGSFNPKLAMFVCNRWDLVQGDKSTQREYTFNKLSKCWPDLDQSQVIYISSEKAKQFMEIDRDLLLPTFKAVLDRLKDTYTMSINNRVQSSYKWLDRILFRSLHHLKTLVKRLDLSDRDLQTRTDDTKTKLRCLKRRADSTIQNLKQSVERASSDICVSFREYLREQRVQFRLFLWSESDIPQSARSATSWGDIKAAMDEAVESRIIQTFLEWEEETKKLGTLEKDIYQEARLQLHVLDEDIERIEHDMQDNLSQSSSDSGQYDGRRSTFGSRQQLHFGTEFRKTRLPVKLARLLFSIFGEGNVEGFKKDPKAAVKKRAQKYYETLMTGNPENDMLLSFVNRNMDRPNDIIISLERNVPKLIRANKQLMSQIREARKQETDNRKLYENMMTEIEDLRQKLMEYGVGNLFVDDFHDVVLRLTNDLSETGISSSAFRASDLLLANTSVREEVRRGNPRGLWHITQNGYITRDETKTEICVRVYLPSAHVSNTFREVSKLRCLEHPAIVDLLGIHRSDIATPTFVFGEHLTSARRYILSTIRNPKQDVPKLMRGTADGLEYLHRKGMVHMELTLGTITVNNDGDVKLSGACLPREASLPLDVADVMTGEFVQLAPEVLRGALYIASADTYSLGLVLLELLLHRRPFEEQRSRPLEHFRRQVAPDKMLGLADGLHYFSDTTANCIRRCVDINPERRPKDEKCVEIMRNLNADDIYLNLWQQ